MGNNASAEAKTISRIFNIADVDSSGLLSVTEIHNACKVSEHLHAVAKSVFKDYKEDHEIALKELIEYFSDAKDVKKADLIKIENELRKSLSRKQMAKSGQHNRNMDPGTRSLSFVEDDLDSMSLEEKKKQQPEGGANCMYGPLLKLSAAIHNKFQERMFYLSPIDFVWFHDNEPMPAGRLELGWIKRVEQKKGKDGALTEMFTIDVKSRDFLLKAKSAEEATMWVNAIVLNRKMVQAKDHDGGKFWKVKHTKQLSEDKMPTIHHSKVKAFVKTGDICLFHSKGVGPKITRGYTGSYWDHAGVFVQYKGKLGVLEALGEPGVLVSSFKAFHQQKWYEQYPCMTIRKLSPEPDKRFLCNFKKFLKKTVGHKYKLSAGKLFGHEKDIAVDAQERTFFCSELVAAAYKEMGLVRPDVVSNDYMPGTFGSDNHLYLLKGASLGPEIKIDFLSPSPKSTDVKF